MIVKVDFSALKRGKWSEYAIRFLLGGGVTVIAGLLAEHYGPVLAGLFLAFPAIFPSSATLVEKHEKEKKEGAGTANTRRGTLAAALDSRGTVLGSVGLICFALTVWLLLPILKAAVTLMIAVVIWLSVSVILWWVEKRHRPESSVRPL